MIDASRIGVNGHHPTTAQLDRVVAAGFTHIRIDVNMDQIRPEPAVVVWDPMDRIVADAVARGLQIYATLAHVPAWARQVEGSEGISWQAWVMEVATRYRGRIRHYGIENEPNAFMTPGGYVSHRCQPAADVLRQVDPTIQICGPELMTEDTDQGTWVKWLKDFAGLLRETPMDIVTVHSYQDNGREVWRHVVGPQTWPMWFTRQPHVREVLRNCGLGEKRLWVTEVGWNTDAVSEAQQASYCDQLLESLPNAGLVEKVFLYQAFDEAALDGKPPVRWGIAHEDLSPKPAFHVVQRYLRPGVG